MMEYKSLLDYFSWDDEIKYVDLNTGIRMAYIEAGNPDKPPLIFLHGHTDTSRSFKISGIELEDDFHLFIPELRGYGHTDKPEVFAYSTMEMAHDIIDFMDRLGLGRIYLSGFSMGSMVAQAVAFSVPDRIQKLMLISSGAHLGESKEDVADVLRDLTEAAAAEKDETFISEWIPTYKQFDPEMLHHYWENLKKIPVQSYAAGWMALSLTDHRNFLQFIKAPVKILWGKEDALFVKERQDELINLIPNVKLEAVDTTHEMLGEDPKGVGRRMLAFFME